VLTRATFSGGQRHAAVWTGDNVASWEHLQLANRQCQRLSISGFSLVGTDIGGFVNQPSPELLIRWIQLGIFHPVFRVHSMGNNIDGAAEADADAVKEAERSNRLDQEPWVFGEPYTSQARRAIEFRYRLLPYLYTAVWQHTQTGALQ
jgi:alpha-glucosidase